MARRFAYLLVVIFLSASSRLTFAQAPTPPPSREGSAEFAFVGTSGNSSTQTLGVGGELILRPPQWETKFKANYVRNEAEDVVNAQSTTLLARAQRAIRPKLSAYGMYGYQRDRFAGIENRNAAEGGLAFKVVDDARQKLVTDVGLGYINEQHPIGEDTSTATFGVGGAYTLKISATSDLSEDAHALFSFDAGEDWRYVNILALTAKITTIFSLKVSNTVRYLNLPVTGFKNTDTVTAVALVAKF